MTDNKIMVNGNDKITRKWQKLMTKNKKMVNGNDKEQENGKWE